MIAWRRRLLLALIILGAAAPLHAERRRVAVLEFRGGTGQAAGLASRLADRLRRTAALTVIDPAEARRRSASIEGDVARCAGAPACIGRLGAALEVDEILLLGISTLGEVVVALQRVDVQSPRAQGQQQLSEVLPSDEAPSDEKLDLWLKQLYPPETFKRYGFIVVTANVDGAEVKLNAQPRGLTPLSGKLTVLAPRTYRVELSKRGYAPFSARIDVPPDASVEVRAELTSDGGVAAWYKRWYVWAIVGGAVAGGAVGVTAYRLQPDNTQVTGTIRFP